ncbi:MAG: DUF3995 domain-containing protein [Janthinobacterium lividum]
MTYLAAFNTLTFLALALLHAYWALGGTAGLAASLPAHVDGRVVLQPSPGMVWLVAVVLLLLAGLGAAQLGLGGLPPKARLVANAIVAAGLLLRTVGDFRYVGFTKVVQDTTFARLDTRYYSPLCLLLAASHAALALHAA